MIQDIAPHVFNNHYENRQPSLDSIVLTVRDGAVLCVLNLAEKDIRFPKAVNFSICFPLTKMITSCVTVSTVLKDISFRR